jgi:hypothetical protein
MKKPKTTDKRPVGRPRNADLDTLQDQLGISRREASTLLREQKDGTPDGGDIRESRAQKERWTAALRKSQSERAEHELAVARGEYILAAEAHEEFRAIGEMVRRTLENWTHTLPPRLEGMTSSQMVPLFQDEVFKILNDLATSDPAK